MAVADAKMVVVPRVKLEGEALGTMGKKRMRTEQSDGDGTEDLAPAGTAGDGGGGGGDGGGGGGGGGGSGDDGDGGVEVAEEVVPAEAERRKIARLIAANVADFIDLT